ncbi:hypothetical protein CERSUDRAFT_67058 [Gelatoporia subvermispora B]|uniref:Uncharacterized protein n=1 Tax=Ceriporiopsis subvermispora (strain B) TaxID=914234 RepID=M2QC82_CERS8|nr:hypothetical protein CERSUDRAFT_67058 [Gelatoporia subvermispora B]
MQGNGGLFVTDEMQAIIIKHGLSSIGKGGQKLRFLFQRHTDMHLDSLVVLGVQRIAQPEVGVNHLVTLEFLLEAGVPPDVEDIVGHTALQHACMYNTQPDTLRCLLKHGANVNHRNRYGEVAIGFAIQKKLLEAVDILMEFNADMKIPEGDGRHWRAHKQSCRPLNSSDSVTGKPVCGEHENLVSNSDLIRRQLGLSFEPLSYVQPPKHAPQLRPDEAKGMTIKTQIPYRPKEPLTSGCYGPNRNFICMIHREDDPISYDCIIEVVSSKGVYGAKAYFSAELKSDDKLVIKVGEVLAEQPF